MAKHILEVSLVVVESPFMFVVDSANINDNVALVESLGIARSDNACTRQL